MSVKETILVVLYATEICWITGTLEEEKERQMAIPDPVEGAVRKGGGKISKVLPEDRVFRIARLCHSEIHEDENLNFFF